MFSVYGSSGFYKAPVSKGLLGTTIASSFALSFPFQNQHQFFIATTQQVIQKQQIWRMLTSKLAFFDLKDLFICSFLIYYFRIFERRLGSKKFSSYLLGSGILGVLLELACLYICHSYFDIDVQGVSSGPMCIVFPMFVPYYFDIPRVAMTSILGIPVTGKTFTYMLGLQTASSSTESRISAICSIIAGFLWRYNFLWLHSIFKIPNFLAYACSSTIGRILKSSPPQNTDLPMGATLELQRQEQLDRLEQQMLWSTLLNQNFRGNNIEQQQNIFGGLLGNNNTHRFLDQGMNTGMVNQQVDDERQVSEEQIQQLVDMGFNADRVRTALRMSNNDVISATNVLLQDL